MKLIPLKKADEFDALTGWRQFLNWRPGQRKRVKRQYNKRFRKHGDMSLHRLHTTKYEDLCM